MFFILLIDKYIFENNVEGEFAGDIEHVAACKLFNIRIIFLTKGFEGYNVFNIVSNDEYDIQKYNTIYILFINDNHFNYLNLVLNENENLKEKIKLIDMMCNNNLNELQKLRKREYPISIKWYPDIFNEMYMYYKYNIVPEERFKHTSNVSLYISRFKELAFKSFYLDADRLYYIKKIDTKRLENGEFEDKSKVILKKIPFVFEILPIINKFHLKYDHISFKTLAKKISDSDFYFNGIEIITEEFCKQCPICFSKYFSKKLIKQPKIILDEGPHYRLLVDITYLDKNFSLGKTKYKYIIDSIDHFSKFYWGFLIIDKSAETTLKKIKNFIGINKKPIILQSDNGLEFKNKLLSDFLKEEGIKQIFSMPHHPQTNGCLERYHREVHNYMKNYLEKYEDFGDLEVESALEEYIYYHNNKKKVVPNMHQMI